MCLSAIAGLATAQTPTPGVMMQQNQTIPHAGVWLDGALGGHFWTSDTGLGLCRVDPAPGATPPFQLSNCQAVGNAGAAVVARPVTLGADGLPTANGVSNASFVFVGDASTKSNDVVRFTYKPSTETMVSNTRFTITPVSIAKGGGGTGGGRTVGVALGPNGRDIYLSYIRVGDVMKFPNATDASPNLTTTSLPVQIGVTSDGGGTNAVAFFKNDLYLSEQGLLMLTRIADPTGINSGIPCNPTPGVTQPCTAIAVVPQISFPAGLAANPADPNHLYIGYAPLTTPGAIWAFDGVSTPTVYSDTVTPSYTSAFDGVTRSQYWCPTGLAFAPNGDLYVGDDPTFGLRVAILPTAQGHLWRVSATHAATAPVITSISTLDGTNSGPMVGGTVVTLTGTNLSNGPTPTIVNFGPYQAVNVVCSGGTFSGAFNFPLNGNTCQATTSVAAFPGPVSVSVQVPVFGSATAAQQFTYNAPPPAGGLSVTGISPTTGLPGGGTKVLISGTGLQNPDGTPAAVSFGSIGATVTCASSTSCTAVTPPGTGTVAVVVAVNGVFVNAPQTFTYVSPTASVRGWGITAPKGGMLWVPGSLGGHWWSSDHANGFCRQDAIPGTTLTALNPSVCDDGSIGSAGQAVYDAFINPAFVNSTTGASVPAGTHFIYVPDNAVKSTAIWRLTFDPVTEKIVGAPEAMIPLADVRTLKPNGMAMGPDGNLYVTDLVELNIRRVSGPHGDPRLQTVTIVAHTGDGRGANGTIGFLGLPTDLTASVLPPTPGAASSPLYKNVLVISENRAASYFDITAPCAVTAPVGATANLASCQTLAFGLTPGVFVAGVATDPINHFVYASDSPGAGAANIWRIDATRADSVQVSSGAAAIYLTSGLLPAAGTANATVWASTTAIRPWDANFTAGGPSTFAFVFGLAVGPQGSPDAGSVFVTEDYTAGNRSGRGRIFISPLVP